MTKQLQNLIDKFGAEQLHRMIDEQVFQEQDRQHLKTILSSDESAVEWFTNWAEQNDLELENPQGRCYRVKGWDTNSHYVYLWLAQRDTRTAHFELGSSLSDLWWAHGLTDLENKLNIILDARETA